MNRGDLPILDVTQDALDRKGAVDSLHRLLSDPELATPLVIGVYGGWGTGKTSVMQMVRRRLESAHDVATPLTGKPRASVPDVISLWFDAWKYSRQEQSLWRAMLLAVIASLRTTVETREDLKAKQQMLEAKLDELKDRLYRSLQVSERGNLKVNWNNAIPWAADITLNAITAGLSDKIAQAVGLKGVAQEIAGFFKDKNIKEAMAVIEREARERYVAQVLSLEQFREVFEDVLRNFDVGTDGHRRLFMFVDDLDRCLPEDAVAALEAIKLFLDLPGCVFILGMDRTVVEQGIRARYKDFLQGLGSEDSRHTIPFDPREYLDKIIQIPFQLPPLGKDQIQTYLDSLGGQRQRMVEVSRSLIETAAPANPRSLKRVLNVLQLMLYLDGWKPEELQEAANENEVIAHSRKRLGYIAKIVLLQICFEDAYRAAMSGQLELPELESIARKLKEGSEESMRILKDKRLEQLLRTEPFFVDVPEDAMKQLVTLSTITAHRSEAK